LAPRPQAPSLAAAPVVDRFPLPSAGGWVFARLTGDYNGIHQWRWYARRFGFPAAFLHPQRVAGMCLAKLHGPDSDAQTLDLWIKGPLFYGANVLLQAAHGEDGLRFGLSLDGDPRAALAGNWRRGSGGDA
jgi:acyl dehydratase